MHSTKEDTVDIGLQLDEDERGRIRDKISNVKPQDEQHVRQQFGEKYGKVGKALLDSEFKVVRDLALNIACLWEMLVDPDYTISWQVKAGIIVGLGYFISPVDLIPDAVPVVGYLDDALVVAYIAHQLSKDISEYREWRREQGRPLPGT